MRPQAITPRTTHTSAECRPDHTVQIPDIDMNRPGVNGPSARAGPRAGWTRVVKFVNVFEHLPPDVTLYEVGPRDGLQNESRMVPTDDKVRLVDALSETGLPAIEITSFVNPKWIPQLADGAEVSRRITRKPGIVYSALVPNRQGLDAALDAGMKEIAVFMSASETHNKKNINKTIAKTLEAFEETVPPARAA